MTLGHTVDGAATGRSKKSAKVVECGDRCTTHAENSGVKDSRPKRKKKPGLTRDEALDATPVRLPTVREEPLGDGDGLRVTVRLAPARWRRFLGSGGEVTRSYELDAFGRDVYRWCDGRTPVRALVSRFAERHHLGRAEAEMSVTQFLNTLMSRGLVAMEIE